MKTSLSRLVKVIVISFAFCIITGNAYTQTQTKAEVPGGYNTRFWIYLPPSYSSGGAESPILISLHGGSGIGDSLEMLTHQFPVDTEYTPPLHGNNAHNSPSRLIYNRINNVTNADKWDTTLPFVVVSPQLRRDPSIANHNEQNWPPDLVDELVDYVIDTYNVDPARVYVTGISLGGTGSWNYAVAYPEKVAALMPLGGKTPKSDACLVKDIPIWAFHGDSDPLVPVRFSTDMLNAVEQCSPAGLYNMQLNTPVSMPHEIWNPIYSLRAGYGIYSWLLSFTKGNNSNHAPFVFAGVDRKVADRTGPIYLTSEYFDSDGEVSNIQWTQLSGTPSLSLDATNSRFLEITDPEPGTFVFRLTATDNDGASWSDDVQIEILADNGTRAVTSIKLYKQEGVDNVDTSDNLTEDFGAISDDAVYDLNVVAGFGSMVNLEAVTTGSTESVGRVRWSINSDQHTRDVSSTFYAKALSGSSAAWIVKKGTYLVCATPYQNSNFLNEGTSLCHKITFTDEPSGLTKYYAQPNTDLSSLASWGTETNGSGTAPSSFATANQWFIVPGTAHVTSAPLNIGTNRLIVETTGQLTFNNTFSGSLYSEGLAHVSATVNGALQASSLVSISRTSTTEFNGGAMDIPAGTYGDLTIKGAGTKTLPTGFAVIVTGNLSIESGANVVNPSAGSNNGINVSGNVTIAQASTIPYVLQIIDGFGNQYVSLPGSYTFRDLIVAGGCTASIEAPGTSTITLGTTDGGGKAEVHTYSLLKLNGHNLTLTNAASINPNSGTGVVRSGQIECDNSVITLTTSSTSVALNFYPATGKNNLKTLDVTIPQAHAGFNVLTPLNITEKLKISNGKINSNGNVTLVSTPTSTAYVASVVGTGSFVGDVNIERSIPAGQVYRYLTFPVTGGTVAELQQHIPVNGDFDENSGSTDPSLFYYNEASTGWIPFPKAPETDASNFVIGKGYSTEIFDAVNPEHITVSGTLHNGDFPFTPLLTPNTIPANNKGWTLLGNPYAAPVNWDSPTSDATTWDGSGISSTVYVRANDQPQKILINDGQVGTFDGNIASGQSFWVRATVPGATLTVKEAAKVEATNVQLYRTQQTDAIYLHFNLSHNNEDDDAFVKFNTSGKAGFDKHRDAVKMKNDFFNLSLLSSDSVGTAIKNLCDTLCSQEITLAVQPKASGTYMLTVEGPAFDELMSGLAIADKFQNKVTTWQEGQAFTFEVTNDPASSHPKRFTLLIDNNHSPRPAINFSDGALFSSVTSNIQWLLNGVEIPGATSPQLVPAEEGEYSVATTYKGCTKTSAGYTFRITDANNPLTPEIRLYPNPANDNLTIAGINSASSSVEYNITSLTGASVQSGLIEYPDGNGEGIIRLQSVAQGFYILNVKNGHNRYQLKFSVR